MYYKKINKMNRVISTFLVVMMASVFAAGFFTSCSDDDENTLSVSTQTLNFTLQGGSSDINVYSTGSWSVVSSESWATASPSAGSGNGAVTISVSSWSDTDGEESRQATITISGDGGSVEITVNQSNDENFI